MRRLPKTLSHEAFREVWRRSRDAKGKSSTGKTRAGSAGVDNVTPAVFGSNLDLQITRIRAELRSGSFSFSKLRLAPVPKNSGGFRIIAVPTVRDRLLQRVLLAHLENDVRFRGAVFSSVSYGFTKGRTLADAQRKARSQREVKPWVLQADIIKFFDNIPRDQVKKIISSRVRSKVIAQLLCNAVDCELDDGGRDGAKIARENGIIKGKGLRQGMPVSPLISNLLLRDFDRTLEKQKISALRYADDLALFATSRSECEGALTFIQTQLAKVGLNIPELSETSKTTIRSPSDPVTFLGVEIKRFGDKYELRAPDKKIESIVESIKSQASLQSCLEEQRDIGRLSQVLDRFIIGHRASMVVLDDPESFISRLEAAKKNAVKQLLQEIIGAKALSNLDADKLAILGIGQFSRNVRGKNPRKL